MFCGIKVISCREDDDRINLAWSVQRVAYGRGGVRDASLS